MNKILYLNLQNKEITVQAGIRWADIVKNISPFRLAIRAMQSFNDFSVCGSLGVNVHGQDVENAPLIKTVKSIKLVMPDGSVINASRDENYDIFKAAIGGYGLIGIIVEATLKLTDDALMKRKSVALDSSKLGGFISKLDACDNIHFFSARFSVGPSDFMQKALAVTYEEAEGEQDAKFYNLAQPSALILQKPIFSLFSQFNNLKDYRFDLERLYFGQSKIISRNNFMNFSISSLPTDTPEGMYILQEYFIPYSNLSGFIAKMRPLMRNYPDANILNISARHVNQDAESLMAYSRQDTCALVLYIYQPKDLAKYNKTVEWTRKLIDLALECDGTYYLPYQLIATKDQFKKSYPRFSEFLDIKNSLDPACVLTNRLFESYFI